MSDPFVSNQEYVYEMFSDVTDGLVVSLDNTSIVIPKEAEIDMDTAMEVAEDLVEDDSSELGYKHIDVLAMIAICNNAEIEINDRVLLDEGIFYD